MRRVRKPFKVYVDQDTDETILVRFVSPRRLERDRLATGQGSAGTYANNVIEVTYTATMSGLGACVWHELGHYFIEREEFRISRKGALLGVMEEDVCDLFTWVPAILHDPRNGPLRQLMGVK